MSVDAERIGKWLRAARERQGMYSQEQAAHQVGTTVKTMGSWERGIVAPPSDTFLALVLLYRANILELLAIRATPSSTKAASGSGPATPEEPGRKRRTG
jgi:DNA-binding XRE family transcriptional regulator